VTALGVAQAHFKRVSFDLIYARPDQSEADWHAELTRALSFGTDHLSLYQLTIEPNTRFATDVRRGAFTPLDDDPSADLFEVTRELTEAAGVPAYEVSNHACIGQESRHNLTYWRYQDYCGIGPGAHGRRNNQATLRHKKPENWLESVDQHGHGLRDETALSPSEQASEALLMGLRLGEGISLPALSDRFALPFDDLIDQNRLAMLRDLGFVWQSNERLGVTPRGMPVLDALLGELVNTDLVTA
jgi:oxygen-independent coproporphyrinogen-3 oxidase